MRIRTPILAILALLWLVVVYRITGVMNSLPLLGVYLLILRIVAPAQPVGRRVHRQRPATTEDERGENPRKTQRSE